MKNVDKVPYILCNAHDDYNINPTDLAIIEHLDIPWRYRNYANEDTQQLSHRCNCLDSDGVDVGVTNTVWGWEDC